MKFIALAVAATAAALGSAPAARAAATNAPPCTLAQIALRTGNAGDAFDGMSHSGTLVVVRNVSNAACSVRDPVPEFSFRDPADRPLAISIRLTNPFAGPVIDGKPMPMGHGPVVLPIVLQPGASAGATLRWVSSPVDASNVCVDVASIGLALGETNAEAPLDAHVCGTAHDVTIDATRLSPS